MVAVGHVGQPLAPHDLWGAWNASPVVVLGLLLAGWLYWRGAARGPAGRGRAGWRPRAFGSALAALSVALLSPLDALSGALASAHMVQHLLLVLVAAPLLALSAPSSALLRGSPLGVRRGVGRWRRGLHVSARSLRILRSAAVVWLLHVAVLWFWHGAVPYGWALEHEWAHALEHATFLLTAVLFWRVVIGARGVRARAVSPGLGILLVFTMGLQSVFLSLLLTFSRSPWYAEYASTTGPWGLDPLTDQQLAGAIMWVPGGLVYLAVALGLLVTWLRGVEADAGDSRTLYRGGSGAEPAVPAAVRAPARAATRSTRSRAS